MTHSAIQIANKVVAATDVEHGELISNLKLQKLLYYMQGFHLAIFGVRLFDADIEAWQYGPVVREIYENFKSFGRQSIELNPDEEIIQLSPEQEDLFNQVLEEYGQFSAIKLMKMTHEEYPWKNVFNKQPQGTIPDKLIKDYFKKELIVEE